jgi:hypothetical protein
MKSTINDILRALQVFLMMIRDTPSILARMIGIRSSTTCSAAPEKAQRPQHSGFRTRLRASTPIQLRQATRTCVAASPPVAVRPKSTCRTSGNLKAMDVDEGDGYDAMDICSDDSSSDLFAPLVRDLQKLDSISFRLALKKARAKHGLFGSY